ncbi:hypothetical protein D9611_003354 [Ephemerocybe angulata]|uniref:Elongator complex protein 4 n=1 Tax=Ephemerocybe angulata TaxID=980116 RepID=A0A8H5C963_9AGAR|nr:hypothetical protein D9611_003354 [Tulosesus angulatus]
MSSFKRKDPSKQSNLKSYEGTRVSPASSSTINTSTGISSLDDILGGGLPLSCSLVIAAPDLHSSYGELVQKYWVAEGLACGHRVCVIDDYAEDFLRDLMWYPKSALSVASGATSGGIKEKEGPLGSTFEDEEDEPTPTDRKVKIAWRYEQMKPFQTTVSTPSLTSENYCHVFDLTSRVPTPVVNEKLVSGKLSLLAPGNPNRTGGATMSALRQVEQVLQEQSTVPIRICIPSLGSPATWGDITPSNVLQFLHSLRGLLRKYPHGCASITLAPHLSSDNWSGSGWLQKVGWVTDASLTLAAFSADPALSATFPSHHGIVHITALPSPSTLVAPSDRFSTLRGLASSASGFGGSGENNLAFKCTRKRLIFETLHLDLDGGVSERRTSAPSSTAVELTTATGTSISASAAAKSHDHSQGTCNGHVSSGGPRIDIEFEGPAVPEEKKAVVAGELIAPSPQPETRPKKPKKKVAFFSDRPDVYDF